MKCFQHHKMRSDYGNQELPHVMYYNATSEEDLFDMGAHIDENLKIVETAVLAEMKINDLEFVIGRGATYPKVHTSISKWSSADEGEGEKMTVWFTFEESHISAENYDVEESINHLLTESPLIRRLEKRFGSEIEVFATYPIDRLFNECEDSDSYSS